MLTALKSPCSRMQATSEPFWLAIVPRTGPNRNSGTTTSKSRSDAPGVRSAAADPAGRGKTAESGSERGRLRGRGIVGYFRRSAAPASVSLSLSLPHSRADP
jgi:hypothetical protein